MTEDGNVDRSYLVPLYKRIGKLEKAHTHIIKNQVRADADRKGLKDQIECVNRNTTELVDFTERAKVVIQFMTIVANLIKWTAIVTGGLAALWVAAKAVIDWIPTHIR